MKVGKIRQVVYEVTVSYLGELKEELSEIVNQQAYTTDNLLCPRAEYVQTFEVPFFEELKGSEIVNPNHNRVAYERAKIILYTTFDRSIFQDVTFLRIEKVQKVFRDLDLSELLNGNKDVKTGEDETVIEIDRKTGKVDVRR